MKMITVVNFVGYFKRKLIINIEKMNNYKDQCDLLMY